MKPVLIVGRVDGFGHLALHLEAHEVCLEKLASRYAESFADGKTGCERWNGRMREQPEDAIWR
jgi:hypothetical protein